MTAEWNRREFLKQSFAFSALTAGARSLSAFTPKSNANARHLLVFGDWGYDVSIVGQTAVAQQMIKYAAQQRLNVEALLMLGDSWYGAMPGGINDPRWVSQFEDMYPITAFNVPAYTVMGNHDYQRIAGVTKTDMELAYAKQPGTRWTQPDLWYTFQFPAVNPIITFIALDSNVVGVQAVDAIDFALTPAQQAAQMRWLEAQLAAPQTTPFRVVVAHHPIFSNGPHGDHQVLIKQWEPLFRKHNVSLYLAGHDHDLQHLEFVGHPTSFVCSGAGGADLYEITPANPVRGPFAEKVYGFTHLEITQEEFVLRHISAAGNIVHAFTKTSKGVVHIEA